MAVGEVPCRRAASATECVSQSRCGISPGQTDSLDLFRGGVECTGRRRQRPRGHAGRRVRRRSGESIRGRGQVWSVHRGAKAGTKPVRRLGGSGTAGRLPPPRRRTCCHGTVSSGRAALAESRRRQNVPWTWRPPRRNNVSSTATTNGAPPGASQPTTKPSIATPTWSRLLTPWSSRRRSRTCGKRDTGGRRPITAATTSAPAQVDTSHRS